MVPFKAVIDEHGAIAIPDECLTALGITVGDGVLLRVENEQLYVCTLDSAIRRAQGLVSRYASPDHSLIDELIAERRAEAAKD